MSMSWTPLIVTDVCIYEFPSSCWRRTVPYHDSAGLSLHPGLHLCFFSVQLWKWSSPVKLKKVGLSYNLCSWQDISSATPCCPSHNPLCFCQKLALLSVKFADGGRVRGSQQGDAASLTANYLSSTSCPTERDRLERWPLAADGVRLNEIASDWPGRGLIEGEEVMSSVNCGFN